MTPEEALAKADAVVAEIVKDAVAGAKGGSRARVTNAPAGAGKTGTVLRMVGALRKAGARVGIVTQTNEQAMDVVGRLADDYPRLVVSFMKASHVEVPNALSARANVKLVEAKNAAQEAVVIATADKWAYARDYLQPNAFDAGIVDEAYQMTSAKLYRVVDYFHTLDLIGDPGQLDPFTTVDDSEWLGLAGNPVMNAVDALMANHPKTTDRALPVTRRLPFSAASVVRAAFYPQLAFASATRPDQRRLELKTLPASPAWAATALSTAAAKGWSFVELPERASVPLDLEIADALATLAQTLMTASARVFDERRPDGYELTEPRVAVGVAHRNQRAAVTIALQQRGLGDVVVDTANRLQGREFDVVLVWHPLAGRTDATAFHLDSGRMCVLTTRHRQACIVVGRGGTAQLLEDHPPPGRVVLGLTRDSEFDGWEAHVKLLEHLATVRAPARLA